MSETERIAKQLERTFTGPAWHGPAVEEVLAGVTADVAARPSPGGVHSVWQIVDHMWYWSDVVRRWIAGHGTGSPHRAGSVTMGPCERPPAAGLLAWSPT